MDFLYFFVPFAFLVLLPLGLLLKYGDALDRYVVDWWVSGAPEEERRLRLRERFTRDDRASGDGVSGDFGGGGFGGGDGGGGA